LHHFNKLIAKYQIKTKPNAPIKGNLQ